MVDFSVEAETPSNETTITHQSYSIRLNQGQSGTIREVDAGNLTFSINGSEATYDGDFEEVPEQIFVTVSFGTAGQDNEVSLEGEVRFSDDSSGSDEDSGTCTVVRCTFSPNSVDVNVGDDEEVTAHIEPPENASDVTISLENDDAGAASLTGQSPDFTVHGLASGGAVIYATLGEEDGPDEVEVNVYAPSITIGSVKLRSTLPDSVAPGQKVDVHVEVEDLAPGAAFDLSVEDGNDGQAGSASLSTSQISSSGTVKVTGGSSQTEPGHRTLHLVGKLNGREYGVFPPFSVCAHPENWAVYYHGEAAPPLVGMEVEDEWTSDGGGAISQLNKVQVKELVQEGRCDAPPFPCGVLSTSGYRRGDRTTIDVHAFDADFLSPPPAGEAVQDQLSVFLCDRCGAFGADVTNSGMRIVHYIVARRGSWFHVVSKFGAAVSVDGHSSAPGGGNASSAYHFLR